MAEPPNTEAQRPEAQSASSATPGLVLIAAVARNGCIGRGNQLVWRHPTDAKWFRQQTLGCPVVMGRKTWDSLPERFRPLPGRPNIVVTRQAGWQAPGAQVAHGLPQALALARAHGPRVVVMGGAQLYAEAMPLADELVLTEVDAAFDGDVFFPPWPRENFTELQRLPQPAEEATGPAPGAAPAAPSPAFDFVVYRRKA